MRSYARFNQTAAAGRRRTAFSMVELMVVVVIIGILAALILPAIGSAQRTARVAQAQSEFEKFKAAIGSFKQRFGVEPPSSLTISEDNSWDPRSRAIIKQIWPQFDFTLTRELNGQAGQQDIPIDGAECLVFFLGGLIDIGPSPSNNTGAFVGFSKNPRNPFQLDTGSRDGPFFEFQGGVDPGTSKPVGRVVDTNGNGVVEYVDSLPSQIQPLVYYSSYGGAGYRAQDNTGRMTRPYYQDAAGRNPYNRESFQLISPGLDQAYGLGGGFDKDNDQWASMAGSATALTQTQIDQRIRDESDNITNFHTGTLD